MLTLMPSFLFYISLNLTLTNNTGFCKRAETKDQTINVFHHNSTVSCCLSTSRLCFQSPILSAMKIALQIITQFEVTLMSYIQYLTHSFAFQIEEGRYGSTFESENAVGERKKRVKEVGTTMFSSTFERTHSCFVFCKWVLESHLLIFSCFSYSTYYNL